MPLTEKQLLKLKPPAKGNALYYDGEVRGFAARITAAGAVSFVLNYVTKTGRERRFTLGQHPMMALADARKEAVKLRTEIAEGGDPLDKRKSEREAPTMKELAEDYMKATETTLRASSRRNNRQMLDGVILPRLGRLQVTAVTRRDIESLHASLSATKYRANRVRALLSTMFTRAIQSEWRKDNPTKGIEKYDEEKRERWLSEEELDRLTDALDAYPYKDAANAIRLLLLTGARKGEVLSATWWDIDLKRETWTKPSHKTKQKKIEHVPLNEVALDLLKAMKPEDALATDYLFPGKIKGTHLQDLKNDWALLCKTAKLENARLHDCRHTFASHLVSSGVPLATVGKLLGHTQSQTTERYAHLAESPLREATNRMGKLIKKKA